MYDYSLFLLIYESDLLPILTASQMQLFLFQSLYFLNVSDLDEVVHPVLYVIHHEQNLPDLDSFNINILMSPKEDGLQNSSYEACGSSPNDISFHELTAGSSTLLLHSDRESI